MAPTIKKRGVWLATPGMARAGWLALLGDNDNYYYLIFNNEIHYYLQVRVSYI